MARLSFHFRIYFFVLAIALAAAAPGAHAGLSYFEMSEVESDNLAPFPKWMGMVNRFRDSAQVDDSQCGRIAFYPCVVLEWKALTARLKAAPLHEKLDAINDWGNEHPYIVDQLNWGAADYWATPYEFMQMNGDCEDYAIAKYYSLLAAGVPMEKLRIIVVQDLNLGGIIHAILGVYDGGRLWILDNQIKQVQDAMSIYHYRPIYGTNERYWWRYYPKN